MKEHDLLHKTMKLEIIPGEGTVCLDTTVQMPLNHEGIIFEEKILPSGTRAIITNKGGIDYYGDILKSKNSNVEQSQNNPTEKSTQEEDQLDN